MAEYASPGVYVEEMPSAVKPIAGVSTSTAGFVGVIPDTIQIPTSDATAQGDAQAQPPVPKGVTLTAFPVVAAQVPRLITNWSQFTGPLGTFQPMPINKDWHRPSTVFSTTVGRAATSCALPSWLTCNPNRLGPFRGHRRHCPGSRARHQR